MDLELEAQIDLLRDTKSKYENILRLATALTSHFQSMVQTQQALGDTFTDLSQKSPELQVAHGATPVSRFQRSCSFENHLKIYLGEKK